MLSHDDIRRHLTSEMVFDGDRLPGFSDTIERTGQRLFPWIEFEDGSIYREESKDMAATIKAGRLREKQGGRAPAAGAPS